MVNVDGLPNVVREAGLSATGQELPLSGLDILAFEHMMAGPFATQILADLGATVVKVEPFRGESARYAHPMLEGEPDPFGFMFMRSSAGKSSIAVDLKHAEARGLILRLVPTFDVVVENFRPGTLDRLGLGWRDLVAVRPDLIQVSISGFGAEGTSPYWNRPAYAAVGDAISGHLDVDPADLATRLRIGNSLAADSSAGLWGALGILAAVRYRDLTGQGRHIDLAMADALLAMSQAPLARSFGDPRLATGVPRAGAWDTFRAGDGSFIAAALDRRHLSQLSRVLAPDDTDVDLDRDRIRAAVERWAADKSKRLAAALLSDAGVPAAPCLRLDEVTHDANYLARGAIGDAWLPSGRSVRRATDPVWRQQDAEKVELPAVGAHTDEVLRDRLRLSRAEIDRLRAAGVIGSATAGDGD